MNDPDSPTAGPVEVPEEVEVVRATLVDCHHGSSCRDTARDAHCWDAISTAKAVLERVGPLIAARVRAEQEAAALDLMRAHAEDESSNPDALWRRVDRQWSARYRSDVLSRDREAARVRAEERQRIAADILALLSTADQGLEYAYIQGMRAGLSQAAVLAAGSAVPVATPEPGVLVEAFQGDDEAGEWLPARWTDDDGGWWLPVDQERSPWRGGDWRWRPVATPELTRFVLVDHRQAGEGRVVDASDVQVQIDYQDDDRTLKVFLTSRSSSVATPTEQGDVEEEPIEDWPAVCPACGALAPNLQLTAGPVCDHWFHRPPTEPVQGEPPKDLLTALRASIDRARQAPEPRPPFRVMEAHLLQDCTDPADCWYEPHRSGERLPAEQDGQPVDWCKGTPEQVAEARAEVAATEARYSVGWEYATTTGPRKTWDAEDVPPEGEGWIRNIARGDNGWERFDYHEESYWKRPKPPAEQDSQRSAASR